MATDMNEPPLIPGQLDIHGGEARHNDLVGTPPAFSQPAASPRDFGRGAPQDFTGHAPQDFGDAQTPPQGMPDWPPPGMTLVPADRILDAITGMTITKATRSASNDETMLRLEGVECPNIHLTITDDGYWTAVVSCA